MRSPQIYLFEWALQRDYRMGNFLLSRGFGSHYPRTPDNLIILYFAFERSVLQPESYLHRKGSLSHTKHNYITHIPTHTLCVLDRGQKPCIWNLCSRGVFPSVCLLQGWTLASGICFLQELARASLRGSGGHRGEEACFGKPLGSA